MITADTIAKHGNTCVTTPRHIWLSQVVQLAEVSWRDMLCYCGLDRLSRWGSAGEPVWMAADSLRKFVVDGRRLERIERESNYLAGKMKVSR